MIRHILKILWNERKQNLVIILEIALIALILWVVVDIAFCKLRNYYSPTGFDIEHVYRVQLWEIMPNGEEYIEDLSTVDKVEALQNIKHQLSKVSGVETASISFSARPGSSGSVSGSIITRQGNTSDEPCLMRMVSPEFLEVYRYQPIGITLQQAMESLSKPGNVLITRDAEQIVLPDGGTLVGDTIFEDESLAKVSGVIAGLVEPIRYSHFHPAKPSSIMGLSPEYLGNFLEMGLLDLVELCIRVEPEAMKGFRNQFIEEVGPSLSAGNYRFGTLQYVPDLFKGHKELLKNDFLTQVQLAVFLLVNVLLGVVGVFWFRVVKRRCQIGLRISFGATPMGAQWQFMLEGALMLLVSMVLAALVMAVVFQFEILDVELIPLDVRRFVEGFFITALLMLCAVLLAVWMATRRTKRIPPAQALREE